MLLVTSHFLFMLYLFGSYVSQYQVFTFATLILTISFVFSALAFLPVMIHVLSRGTERALGAVNGRGSKHETTIKPITPEQMKMLNDYEDYLAIASDGALGFTDWVKVKDTDGYRVPLEEYQERMKKDAKRDNT
jgi:hypothetical protein